MTADEFSTLWRALNQELFVPNTEKKNWAEQVGKLSLELVMKSLDPFIQDRRSGIRVSPDPADIRTRCELYHGFSKQLWEIIEENYL